MKNLILLFCLVMLGGAVVAQPICQPDSTFCTPDITGADEPVCDNRDTFPTMIGGQYYEEDLGFIFARQTVQQSVTVQLTRVRVVNVTGLPAGMLYVVYSANPSDQQAQTANAILNRINGSDYGPIGCAVLYGTVPTSGVPVDATDSLTINIIVDVTATMVGGPQLPAVRDTSVYRVKYQQGPVSIAELNPASVNLQIAPNPMQANTAVKFDLASAQKVSVDVTDINGRVVFSQNGGTMAAGSHSIQMPFGDMANGVYLVRLNVGGRVHTAKLVK